jgi:glycine cleavage system regulatory protein
MNVPLVLTVIGSDRTGLVESVASLIAAHDGNWLESRMCRLGGEFAGILRMELPADREATFTSAIGTLQSTGLTVVVRRDQAGRPASPETVKLELVGQDRPGIVRQITQVLAAHRVNVEELSTECLSAPMSGETLFKAEARLHLPDACDMAVLRRELEKIAADLMVDVTLSEETNP